MLKGFIIYTSEDAAYDELAGLNDFRNRNLHPEHNGDIDLVRYEKRGNAIHFESENGEALNYVMGFASETEDNVPEHNYLYLSLVSSHIVTKNLLGVPNLLIKSFFIS